MNPITRCSGKCLSALIALLFFSTVQGQVKPPDETFTSSTTNSPQGVKAMAFPVATPHLIYSMVSPIVSTNPSQQYYISIGDPPGSIFRPSNKAFVFNYGLGGSIPGTLAGSSGTGDYRIHFSPGDENDTISKAGNFQIKTMYLAIGNVGAATVTIQGFRAGRMIASDAINNLSNGQTYLVTSTTDLAYNNADAFGGVNITFGTNWGFLDELIFKISDKTIPLLVDDLTFDFPAPIAPSSQASSEGFSPTGITSLINWTRGNGDYSAVFMSLSGGSASPTLTNGTDYTANAIFGSGSTAGAGWFCVYNGQGASTIVNGLSTNTTYRVMVVSYNGNTGFGEYNTTERPPGITSNIQNFTTLAVPSQATDVGAANITGTTADLSWTAGGGNKRAVFVKNTSTGTATPVFNTNYAAATSMGAGSQISTTGWYCVFNGTGTSVTVTGLTAGQTYRVMATEYNDGGFGSAFSTFNTSAATNNPVNFTMDNVPVVTSSAATSVTHNSATLNGSINDMGDNTATSFQYSISSGLTPSTTVAGSPLTVTEGTGLTTITGTLSGLNPSTTYYYRVRGVNAIGPAIGSILNFITAPAVQLVNSSLANGSYKAGVLIPIRVVFTGAVTVTGSPTLALSTGGTATYASGSGSNSIIFNYTIAAGHTSTDLNYSSTSALSLNGGTIQDANSNNASITLPPTGAIGSLAGQKDLVVDTQDPTLSSVTIVSNNATTTLAKVGDIVTLNFTSSETLVTPTVTIAGHAISATNGSGNNWSVAYTMVSGDATGMISFSIPFNDIAGNAGTTTTATTNSSSVVFDKTAPVLTPVTIGSNNTNTSFAKTGDIVTLNFTASETINTPTVTLAGHAVTAVNTSANNWKADYTMVSGDADGVISINVSFSDPAANNGTAVTATTNSSSVTFDKTVPSLSSISIASNNANTSLVKAGETITLSFTSSESINAPVVIIAGHSVTATNTAGNNWTATYTMVAGDATGTVTFNISFSDLAGNAGTAVSATTNSSSVVYDKTAPVLSSVSIASSHTNTAYAKVGQTITLSFTSGETIFTPTVTIHGNTATVSNSGGNNWSATYTMTNADAAGTVSFNIVFTDLAGNTGVAVTATTNSSSVLFDKTAPSLSFVSIASNNANTSLAKTGQAITLNFTAGETITTPSVTIAGHTVTATNTGGNNWSAVYTMVSGDAGGTVSFNISFSDLAGNAGTAVSASTNSSAVVYDKTVPSLPSVSIASNNNNTAYAKTGQVITVSFSSSESIETPTVTLLGHAATVTNTGANSWTAVYTTVSGDAAGNIPFTISFSDLTGNAGTTVTTTTNSSSVLFDKTPPSLTAVSIVSDNGNTVLAKPGNTVTVNFTSDETIIVPVVSIAGNTVTATNTSGNNWTAAYTMVSGDASGNISFNIAFSDLANNAGTTVTATTNASSVTFDQTVPVLSSVSIVSDNANTALAKTGNTVTINFTSGETINTPVATIAGHTVTANNTSGNNWVASYAMVSGDASGNVSFSISFTDLAGNAGVTVSTTTNSSSVVYDKTGPSLTTVSIVSNNADPLLAKPGDIVTLNFVSAEAIVVPSVTIAGNTAAITTTGSNNWIANYTMTGTDASGTIPFAIACTDPAGNTGITVATTTNSSSVVFDKTAPLVTSIVRQVPSAAVVNATSVTYRVSFSEAVKGIAPSAFLVTTSGATTGTVASVSSTTGTAIDVTVNGISGNGTVRLDLKTTGTGITDAAGNAFVNGFNSGETYTINQSILSFAAGSTQTFALCVGNGTPTSLTNMLRVAGGDNGQTLTWTIFTNPSHGTLNGFPATATITGTPTTPAALSYLATNGYTGTDVFTVQVSDGVMAATASVTVTVNALPIVTITAAQGSVLCGTGASLPVTASGGTTYTWYNNGSVIQNATGAQLTVNAIGSYTAKAIDAAGCTGIEGSAIVITQFQKPTVAFNYTSYCIGKPVSFIDQSVTTNSGSVNYLWNDGNNNTSTSVSPVFTYNQQAVYNVKLKITPAACPSLADSLTRVVSIETPVAAIRMATMNVAINDHVPLQARTFGTGYQWSPSNGLSSANSSNTIATISNEQQYTVAISVASGCITVDTILLKVFVANDLLVPNIFSPNNDGQNDKLFVNLVGIKTLQYFRVFNRYGKKLFETANLGEGWDGKLNGVPQPVDTYIWTAMGVTREGAPVYREGTITLVR